MDDLVDIATGGPGKPKTDTPPPIGTTSPVVIPPTGTPAKPVTTTPTPPVTPPVRIPLPNYDDPQSRLNYAQQWTKKYGPLMQGRGDTPLRVNETPPDGTDTAKNMSIKAAKSLGLDPALLYSSAMEEGMSGVFPDKKNQVDTADDPKYPVDGFASFGLDTFGGRFKGLVAKGYLPPEFANNFKKDVRTNEKKQSVVSADFKDIDSALQAKAAMMKDTYDDIDSYAKKRGITLSPKARDFFALADYNCHSQDTEVLTNNGWKFFFELDKKDKVASLDTSTNQLVYDFIIKYHEYDYNGEMIVADETLKFKVTPNHKMIVKKNHQSKTIHLEYADRAFGTAWQFCVSADSDHKEYNISDEKIKITAWILTDGSIVKSSKNAYKITIYQAEGKHKIITGILDKIGYKYGISVITPKHNNICGKIKKIGYKNMVYIRLSANAKDEIMEYIDSKKNIPQWVGSLSKRQFDIFIQSFIDGDGNRHPRCVTAHTITKSPEIIDQLQALCLKYGYKTNSTEGSGDYKRLNIVKNRWTRQSLKREQYTGKVYCVETKLGTLVTRYRGYALISGNSGEGTGHQMLNDYYNNGHLEGDKFLQARPVTGKGLNTNSYKGIYENVIRRTKMASALKAEGLFE